MYGWLLLMAKVYFAIITGWTLFCLLCILAKKRVYTNLQ